MPEIKKTRRIKSLQDNSLLIKVSMEGSSSVRVRIFVTLFIVLMIVAKQMHVHADSPYTCWGGCYNRCIVLNFQAGVAVGSPCYVQCLSKCIPRSAAEYQDYCKIGCSLELCVPTRSGAGADLDKCFASCGNVCRV